MFEAFITLRQCRILCSPTPPAVLKKVIGQETFAKTQRYGLAKARFSLGSGLWYTTIKYLYLRFDILTNFWHLSGVLVSKWAPADWAASPACQSVLFAVLYLAANMAESVPPQLYQTFVIEQSFGFNRQSVAGFVADQIKTFAISTTFLIPAVTGFLHVIGRTGDRFAVYLGLGALGLRIFIITVYPDFILPMFYKMSPLEGKEYKNKIMALTTKLLFPLTKLYVANGSSRSTHSNAFFFGLP